MGRNKIKIERLTNERNRQATFTKRKNGLIKKAMELSILCDCDVTLLVFGINDKLYQYSSSPVQLAFERFAQSPGAVVALTNDDYSETYEKKGGTSKGDSDLSESDAKGGTSASPMPSPATTRKSANNRASASSSNVRGGGGGGGGNGAPRSRVFPHALTEVAAAAYEQDQDRPALSDSELHRSSSRTYLPPPLPPPITPPAADLAMPGYELNTDPEDYTGSSGALTPRRRAREFSYATMMQRAAMIPPIVPHHMMSMPQHMHQQQQQHHPQLQPHPHQQQHPDYQPFMRYDHRGYPSNNGSTLPPLNTAVYGMPPSPVEAMVAFSGGSKAPAAPPPASSSPPVGEMPAATSTSSSSVHAQAVAPAPPARKKRNLTIDIPEPTHKQIAPFSSSSSALFDARQQPGGGGGGGGGGTGTTPGRSYLPAYHPLSTAAAAAHIAALGDPDGGGGSAGGALSELGSALISPRFAWSWNSPRTCSPRNLDALSVEHSAKKRRMGEATP